VFGTLERPNALAVKPRPGDRGRHEPRTYARRATIGDRLIGSPARPATSALVIPDVRLCWTKVRFSRGGCFRLRLALVATKAAPCSNRSNQDQKKTGHVTWTFQQIVMTMFDMFLNV